MNRLERFLNSQKYTYKHALDEVSNGKKRTHWMWYIFPQLSGLGNSEISKTFAIEGRQETVEYAAHPILGERLRILTRLILDWSGNDISEMFEYPDNLKLQSCMTLFYMVTGEDIFKKVLDKYYQGEECNYTREHLDDETVTAEYSDEGEIYAIRYSCSRCGCNDILETFSFCPECGRKIITFLMDEKKYF